MSIFDKISDRVGDFLGEVFLPEDVRQAHEQAATAIKRGNYKAALQILGHIERTRPGIERTHHLMGLCHFYTGSLEQALGQFRQAIAIREEASSHFYAGLTAEQLKNYHDAQVHFLRALTIAVTPPFEFDLYYGLGRVYLAQNRPDKAIKELRKALRIWPDQGEAALTLAEALLDRGQLDEAAEILSSTTATMGAAASRRALIIRGRVEEARGQIAAARVAFEQAVERDSELGPGSEEEKRTQLAEALTGAARTCLSLGDNLRANEYLLRSLQDADADARTEIFVLLGRTNEAISNDQKALESYQTALQAAPDHMEAMLGAGRIALRMGNFVQANDAFEAVIKAGPSPLIEEALLGLAQCRMELADYAGARHLFEEVEQLSREPHSEALFGLGRVALKSGDPAEAVVALRDALHAAALEDAARASSTDSDSAASAQVERIEREVRRALQALRPRWNLPPSHATGLDDSVDLVNVLHQLKDFVLSDTRLSRFVPSVQQLLTTMDAPLSIAIVGEFNAGKSTLVNAILSEEVVPMGVLPTTAHTCIVQYGPRKAARIAFLDGRLEEVGFDEARKQMKAKAEEIDRLDYLYPHPELRSVHFWDTPGFNALDERHEETAAWALENGESILWVLDANQVLSQTEFDRIQSLPAGSERLIVLINKIDRLGPPEERGADVAELIEYVQDHAGDHIAGVFPISGLDALKRRSADEVDPDFEAFWSFLDAHIMQRSGRIKALEVSRQLMKLIEEIVDFQQDLVRRYIELGESAGQVGSWVEELGQRMPEARADREAADLGDRIEFVLMGVEREIFEALKPRGAWFTKMVLSEEDQAFVLELLKERLRSALELSRRSLLNEIAQIETELARRMSPILEQLSVTNARAMNRRLEGFFDETRVLKLLLEERVYGQHRARANGQIDAAGPAILQQIKQSGDGSAANVQPRTLLGGLVPQADDDLRRALANWYAEFFLAAARFCVRLQRDLSLLELEAQYRYDISELHVEQH